MAVFEFTCDQGNRVSIHTDQIKHVARPKGNYPGELELTTGAKWGFGGDDRQAEYRRAKAAFELAHEDNKEKGDAI